MQQKAIRCICLSWLEVVCGVTAPFRLEAADVPQQKEGLDYGEPKSRRSASLAIVTKSSLSGNDPIADIDLTIPPYECCFRSHAEG